MMIECTQVHHLKGYPHLGVKQAEYFGYHFIKPAMTFTHKASIVEFKLSIVQQLLTQIVRRSLPRESTISIPYGDNLIRSLV